MRQSFHLDHAGRASGAATVHIARAKISPAAFETAATGDGASRRFSLRALQSAAARTLLLDLLANVGGDLVANWQLRTMPDGRPFVDGKQSPHVSLSHSGEWIACAVCKTGPIGVDVEVLRPRDWPAWGELALHPTEIAWVMSADASERDERGLLCWCRKESFVKSAGVPLWNPTPAAYGFAASGLPVALPGSLSTTIDWGVHSEVIPGEAVICATWQ